MMIRPVVSVAHSKLLLLISDQEETVSSNSRELASFYSALLPFQ